MGCDHFYPVTVGQIAVQSLRIVLVLLGLFFVAGIYPLLTTVRGAWQANNEDATPMMRSLYVTLGIFLLLAARDPSQHRSLIAFTAWSSLAHAAVMTVMAVHVTSAREGLLMVSALFGVIGVALIALAPAKP